MQQLELSQKDADALLLMAKSQASGQRIVLPKPDSPHVVELSSLDDTEQFLLDLRRGSIALTKGRFQLRGRVVIILARLEIGGSPHRNPDGRIVRGPHLHLYREGFHDRWAFPLPPPEESNMWHTEPYSVILPQLTGTFTNVMDLNVCLFEFLSFCHIR